MLLSSFTLIALLCNILTVQAEYRVKSSDFDSSYGIRIKDLPPAAVCESGSASHVGWADIDSHHLFYWYFESRNSSADVPLMVWFTGGPGGSGLVAAFVENGPCLLKSTTTNETTFNPLSWTEKFHVVYVDQPVGVGLSYRDDRTGNTAGPSRTEEAAIDIVAFLKLLYLGFPHLADRKLHLAGESYAGRYLPIFGETVLQYNDLVGKNEAIPLTSVIAISPWMTASSQLTSVYDVACFPFRGYPAALNETTCTTMFEQVQGCENSLQACTTTGDEFMCAKAGAKCNDAFSGVLSRQHTNKYDRRMRCAEPGHCYPLVQPGASNFINQPEIFKDLLEIPQQTQDKKSKFEFSDDATEEAFTASGDIFMDTSPYISAILDHHLLPTSQMSPVPMLFAVGETDMLVNAKGVQNTLEAVKWSQYPTLRAMPFDRLSGKTQEGGPAGQIKRLPGLWFTILNEAGHLAPADQPLVLFDLLEEWLSYVAEAGESYASINGHVTTVTNQAQIPFNLHEEV